MASNHTEHFGLSQWDLSDSVLMADFNEDNAKLEAALSDLQSTVSLCTENVVQIIEACISECFSECTLNSA